MGPQVLQDVEGNEEYKVPEVSVVRLDGEVNQEFRGNQVVVERRVIVGPRVREELQATLVNKAVQVQQEQLVRQALQVIKVMQDPRGNVEEMGLVVYPERKGILDLLAPRDYLDAQVCLAPRGHLVVQGLRDVKGRREIKGIEEKWVYQAMMERLD